MLIEKVRWSLRQRMRKQLHLLSGDYFDEVDDFLFSGGQKGQFSPDSVYLNAMREIRARQAHFDSIFLDRIIDVIKQSYAIRAGGSDQPWPAARSEESAAGDAVFEKMEVDLALQAMVRKADKAHLPVMRQLASMQDRLHENLGARIIGSRVVLDATVDAFIAAHTVFNVPLEIRLLLIKLFEHHFILKLEKVFLDIISIINNISDPTFVDKLYSSSSAMRTRVDTGQTGSEPTTSGSPNTSWKPGHVETAVDQLIKALCQDSSLPAFVTTMLHRQWRAVMFLIGMNRGTLGMEWIEARHTANLLVTTVGQRIDLGETEQESLIEQLSKGFALAQMPREQQEEFFLDLDQYLHEDGATDVDSEKPLLRHAVRSAGSRLEASVSPSGSALLDQQDLDDIARMLGEEKTAPAADQLSDYLRQVDELAEGTAVDFMLNGAYTQCLLRRGQGNNALFTVSRQGAQVSVTRSRLGLALALQSGELRL
ncbi:MAG: DUF1631 family protein, partial [Pseudohongiellaceae bacterium]